MVPLPPWASKVLAGAAVGACAGAALAGAKAAMSRDPPRASQLGVATTHLSRHEAVVDVLLRFRAVASVSQEAHAYYTSLVAQCDRLFGMEGAKGGAQVQAHRLSADIGRTATRLSKQAVRSSDLHVAPLTSDCEDLEALVNNFMHNLML